MSVADSSDSNDLEDQEMSKLHYFEGIEQSSSEEEEKGVGIENIVPT